jgi:hypothetical protein
VVVNWGTSTHYTLHSNPVNASGVTATQAQFQLSNLKPLTTYHYQVVITTPDGTVSSIDQTFTTNLPAITVLKLTPSTLKRGANVTLTYNDTEMVKTTFKLARCKKMSGGPCRSSKTLISFSHQDSIGANTLTFRARAKGKALPGGTYKLQATPAQGKYAGRTITVTFTIR